MDSPIIPSAISLLAVIVSLASVLISYRNQRRTLTTTRAVAWASKEADYRRSQIDSLREELSEFCLLVSDVQGRFAAAKLDKKFFPRNTDDQIIQHKAEHLYQKILMRLNPKYPLQANLLAKIKALRDDEEYRWIEYRDDIVSSARTLFEDLWNSIELEHENRE